jgi:hypothetical protein
MSHITLGLSDNLQLAQLPNDIGSPEHQAITAFPVDGYLDFDFALVTLFLPGPLAGGLPFVFWLFFEREASRPLSRSEIFSVMRLSANPRGVCRPCSQS